MGRNSLGLIDYIKLAQSKGVEFRLQEPPATSRTITVWYCPICGRRTRRSYHSMRYMRYGCLCQTSKTLKSNDYHRLAQSLGIEWVGNTLPKNVHQDTSWYNKEQDLIFRASYKELHSEPIAERLQKYLVLFSRDEA